MKDRWIRPPKDLLPNHQSASAIHWPAPQSTRGTMPGCSYERRTFNWITRTIRYQPQLPLPTTEARKNCFHKRRVSRLDRLDHDSDLLRNPRCLVANIKPDLIYRHVCIQGWSFWIARWKEARRSCFTAGKMGKGEAIYVGWRHGCFLAWNVTVLRMRFPCFNFVTAQFFQSQNCTVSICLSTSGYNDGKDDKKKKEKN